MSEFEGTKIRLLASKSFAELVVIIVGILLAVAANDWWTNREQRLEEAEILQAIAQDIVASQQDLQWTLDRLETAHHQLVVLSEGSAGRISGVNDERLTESLYSLFDLPPINIHMSSYDEIKSSGRLRLIESPALRRRLADYDTQYAFASQTHRDAFQHQQLKLDAYLLEHVQLSQLSELALGEKADAGSDNQQLSPLSEVRDHRYLLDDATFQNHVAFKYYLVAYYLEQLRTLRAKLVDVSIAIDNRIAEIC